MTLGLGIGESLGTKQAAKSSSVVVDTRQTTRAAGTEADGPAPLAAARARSFAGYGREESLCLRGTVAVGALVLQRGGQIPDVQVAYELVGPARAPVVVALGGISATCSVTGGGNRFGWWQELFGPGQAVDTEQWRVLSFDFLGGNGATTGPRLPGYHGQEFPDVTTGDQAAVLVRLMQALGIAGLAGFVGASYGGMVGLALAQTYPHLLKHLTVISAAHRASAMGTAWRSIQRQIVALGLAHGAGGEGLALARALAMTTYRTPAEFDGRFATERREGADPEGFAVCDYLKARGEAYRRTMDPQAFLCLSRSIDLHQVTPTAVVVPTTLFAVAQDQLVPADLMVALAAELPNCMGLHCLDSFFGHDAFLKESRYFAAHLRPLFT